jgi:hypothetical protein
MRTPRSRPFVSAIIALGMFASLTAAPDIIASAAQPEGQPVVVVPVVVPVVDPVVPAPPSAEEPKAKLTLNPAARTVVVAFGKTYARRPAVLEKRELGSELGGLAPEWVRSGASKKLDSKGRATFKTDVVADLSYRVALRKSGPRRARYSSPVTLADQWASDFSDHFDAQALDPSSWSDRAVGAQVTSRLCSVPSDQPTARFVAGSEFSAGITKHTVDEFFTDVVTSANLLADARLTRDLAAARHLGTKHKRRAAIAKAKAQHKLTHNCPRGVFENAMVSTGAEGSGFRVNTARPGIVAARVKFPVAQGMHAGIWLQSFVRGGAEIDIAETFGYSAGLVNYIHAPSTGKMDLPGNPKAMKRKGGPVYQSKTISRKWWDAFHDVSVEWTSTKFVFRVDGTVTKTINLKPGNAEYYLILSMLSSDWELPRLAHPIRKGKPVSDLSKQKFRVDWVRIWSKVA